MLAAMLKQSGPGSVMVRRRLGRRLRQLREEAGRTLADLNEAKLFSETKMWRIETGRTAVKPSDMWTLARFYDLPNDVLDTLVTLAEGTSDDAWFEAYGEAVPEWLGIFAGLEEDAATIRAYNGELMVGLVQTADYARAVISRNTELTDVQIDKRVAFRLEHQAAVLDRRGAADVHVVLGSGALHLVVGSPGVMAEQIAYLHELSLRPHVEIRIRPWSAGAPYPDVGGPFTLLDFDDPADPAQVHLVTYVGSKYLEQPSQVARFRRIFSSLELESVSIEEYPP